MATSNASAVLESKSTILMMFPLRTELSKIRSQIQRKLKRRSLANYKFLLNSREKLSPSLKLARLCVSDSSVAEVEFELLMNAGNEDHGFINIVGIYEHPQFRKEENEPGHTVREFILTRNRDKRMEESLELLGLPRDPLDWSSVSVLEWLRAAARCFGFGEADEILQEEWNMSGEQLCCMPLPEFLERLDLTSPDGSVDLENSAGNDTDSSISGDFLPDELAERLLYKVTTPAYTEPVVSSPTQLWHFLLDLLTDCEMLPVIRWYRHGVNSEFVLLDPNFVAKLWGARRGKQGMNYEKLSRSLRYYYDGNIIEKTPGLDGRFVYRYVCDLEELFGYSAQEMDAAVWRQARELRYEFPGFGPREHEAMKKEIEQLMRSSYLNTDTSEDEMETDTDEEDEEIGQGTGENLVHESIEGKDE